MKEHNPVFLAWQSPDTRSWHVVGALTETNGGYEFHYTKGAVSAGNTFIPFSGMEDLEKSYVSKELFPLFHNRLLSNKRPEYPSFIQWLGLSEEDATPINILARSGAIRGTDQLQMFRRIDIEQSGSFEHFFFLHGLSHLNKSAQKRVDGLTVGERLYLCLDCQNQYDSQAVIIRADNPAEIVGYCPRYLANDISKLLEISSMLIVSVEKITRDAPKNYQLMCKVSGQLRDEFLQNIPLPTPDEYEFTV